LDKKKEESRRGVQKTEDEKRQVRSSHPKVAMIERVVVEGGTCRLEMEEKKIMGEPKYKVSRKRKRRSSARTRLKGSSGVPERKKKPRKEHVQPEKHTRRKKLPKVFDENCPGEGRYANEVSGEKSSGSIKITWKGERAKDGRRGAHASSWLDNDGEKETEKEEVRGA